MNDYEAYRRTQIEDGKVYQDFVVDVAYQAGLPIVQYASRAYQLAVGESRGGIEIKHDKKYVETGNLCIEVAEKARPRPGAYAPSGIMREDHWLYVIGNYDIIFFFSKTMLHLLYRSKRYREYETETSQGFLIPDEDAMKFAGLILKPNASGKLNKTVAELDAVAREFHKLAKANPSQMTLFK